MSDNENKIRDLEACIDYYKKHIINASTATGKSRKIYMDTIKEMETEKQLFILKERNIKG